MPELAEVELARRIWEPGLGKHIVGIDCHPRTRIFRDTPASEISSALSNTTLTASRAHGKRLLFSFTPHPHRTSPAPPSPPQVLPPEALHLELHLGMAGRLYLAAPDYPPAKHDHFVLRTSRLALVYSDYRQFGRVYLHQSPEDPWKNLPPQVLDRRFTLAHLVKLTKRRRGTAVKALLLDQNSFPGIGNWMADEICWRLPCHPATAVGTLDPALLRRVARAVCRGAMRHVADQNPARDGARGFSPGSYVERVPPHTWLFQHRWKPGGNCPRCGAALDRTTVASRTTAFCPACQGPE